MQVTQKNCKIADAIIEIFANEKCTVEESQEILNSVSIEIRRSSTVQVKETFTNRFKDVI